MLTVEQAQAAFTGHEPNRGGYGSEFTYEQHEDGVLLTLEAQWGARSSTPTVLVVEANNTVKYREDDYGTWETAVNEDSLDGFCDLLAERASGA